MRVIFDLSSLHGDNFCRLRDSGLQKLVRTGRCSVFHTPVFLEEVLLGARSARHRDRWADVLHWAAAIPPRGYFLDKGEIWYQELVAGRGRHARHVYPAVSTRRLSSHGRLHDLLVAVADRDDLSAELAAVDDELMRNEAKRRAQKQVFQEVRETVASQAKRIGANAGDLKGVPFWRVLRRDRPLWAAHLVDLLGAEHSAHARSLVRANLSHYPFFAAFVDGIVFSGYFAACRPDEKIDRNAQADFEQLCYLQWADVFVSNDTKFLSAAFEALWKPKGRRLLTTDALLDVVARLA